MNYAENFSIRSDNRVKKHLEGQLDLFPLGATFEDIQNSEELTVKETKNLDQERPTSWKEKRSSLIRKAI